MMTMDAQPDWQSWCAGLNGKTTVTGVFGWPVEHSLSPPMHNAAFAALGLNWAYVPFPVQPEELRAAIAGVRALGIRGVNVTIPHKSAAIEFLDELDDVAATLEAANTIDVCDGRLTGYNTDGPGFVASMREIGWSAAGRAVTIIGAGGSSRAVAAAVLREQAGRLSIINRTPAKAEALALLLSSGQAAQITTAGLAAAHAEEWVREAEIVVDCTSVGMYPHVDVAPVVPAGWLHEGQLVCDLTYNPRHTVLLKVAQQRGAETLDGTGMLVHQGAIAFEQWTGQPAPIEIMRQALLNALQQRPA